MIQCQICKKEFEKPSSLVSHLSNPKGNCKISIKEYYDKYLRKENEGICQVCKKETYFAGIVQGYPTTVCKYCKSKLEKTKLLKKINSGKKREMLDKEKEVKKINDGYYDFPIQCELCKESNSIYKCKTYKALSTHLRFIHPQTTIKEYYDKYLKKENEGICPITGKQTNFKNLREGYFVYKNKGTCVKDSIIIKKSKDTIFKNHGVTAPTYVNTEQRVRNYKNTVKKRIDLNNERINLISLLRKLTIDKTNKNQCQICGRIFRDTNQLGLHIKIHNIKIKEYYDIFFKKENEGLCPISNLETNFDSLERGYFKYHKLFITYTDEIKNGNKKRRIDYIQEKIKMFENIFDVQFIDLKDIEHIGDLTRIKCNKCGTIYKNRFTNLISGFGKCERCNPRNNHRSSHEKEMYETIKTFMKDEIVLNNCKQIIKNPNTGNNLELDIYIPSKKIAIEFNGLYWHSELILNEKAERYHFTKWNECKKEGIQLIQIFEDEWYEKKDIVLSMIKHKLGYNSNKVIYARKCIIKEITSNEKNNFLDSNHIQGRDLSKIKLGAFYDNKLVAVMTFGLGNISRGGNPYDLEKWELSRFVTKKEYHVIGIAGKLLEYFKKNYHWKEIYSYADLRISNGNLYKKLGFNLIKQNPPNYFYVWQTKRIHRFNLRKTLSEPENIPEWRLRLDQGYYRIWDCGNLKFSLTK